MEECELCNIRKTHTCGILESRRIAKNCPCSICLVKAICNHSCHIRYEYLITNGIALLEIFKKHEEELNERM